MTDHLVVSFPLSCDFFFSRLYCFCMRRVNDALIALEHCTHLTAIIRACIALGEAGLSVRLIARYIRSKTNSGDYVVLPPAEDVQALRGHPRHTQPLPARVRCFAAVPCSPRRPSLAMVGWFLFLPHPVLIDSRRTLALSSW